MELRRPPRLAFAPLLALVQHESSHAAGGSISAPGLSFLMLHLPLIACVVLLLMMASNPFLRPRMKRLLKGFLLYVAVTFGLWMMVLANVGPKAIAALVLTLMFLAPWPVFVILYRAYRRAMREANADNKS